jgi:hypothetical protein
MQTFYAQNSLNRTLIDHMNTTFQRRLKLPLPPTIRPVPINHNKLRPTFHSYFIQLLIQHELQLVSPGFPLEETKIPYLLSTEEYQEYARFLYDWKINDILDLTSPNDNTISLSFFNLLQNIPIKHRQ